MSQVNSSFWRDANRVPITTDGLTVASPQLLTANNTTASNILFRVTGSVEIRGLWGVVTTVLSSNITAAHYRINDQTAQPAISLASGTTLSSAAVGSVITRDRLAATALTFINSSAGRVTEASAVNLQFFSPFVITQKTGGVQTDVEFRYSTTNTPATGAVQFFIKFLPLSEDGNIVAV
jgi:hypothetical protein